MPCFSFFPLFWSLLSFLKAILVASPCKDRKKYWLVESFICNLVSTMKTLRGVDFHSWGLRLRHGRQELFSIFYFAAIFMPKKPETKWKNYFIVCRAESIVCVHSEMFFQGLFQNVHKTPKKDKQNKRKVISNNWKMLRKMEHNFLLMWREWIVLLWVFSTHLATLWLKLKILENVIFNEK